MQSSISCMSNFFTMRQGHFCDSSNGLWRGLDSLDQGAKKVLSDSPGLADVAVGLLNSVLNLTNRRVKFWNSNYRRTVLNPACSSKFFFGLVEMTFGLVHVSYSLPKRQAVILTLHPAPDNELTQWKNWCVNFDDYHHCKVAKVWDHFMEAKKTKETKLFLEMFI